MLIQLWRLLYSVGCTLGQKIIFKMTKFKHRNVLWGTVMMHNTTSHALGCPYQQLCDIRYECI